MKKIMLAVIMLAAAVVLLTVSADDGSAECTGYYFGPDITEDGTTIIGQSADVSPYYQIHYEVYEESYVPGRTIDGLCGFKYALPDHTYRYTNHVAYKMMVNGSMLGKYAGGGCINSQGVACTGSITGVPNFFTEAYDPYIKTGLGEETATSIVGACASSSREGVLLLMKIVDEQGSSESNMFLIADQKETWYLEIYGGHQYAAVLLPTDVAIFTGNEFGIKYVEDYKEYYVSKDLKKLAVDNSFAVIVDGKLDVEATYSKGKDYGYIDSSHIRSWRGRNLLAPTQFPTYDVSDRYDLTFKPANKVSIQTIISIMQDRNEGTSFCPDEGSSKYCIGNYNAAENHIIQIFKDRSKDTCLLKWEELGFPAFGIFIPVTVGVNSHIDEFGTYSPNIVEGKTMYDLAERLFSVCSKNMNAYKDGVKAAQKELQNYIFRTFKTVWDEYLKMEDRNKADAYLTDYVRTLERMTYEQTESVYNDVIIWNLATIEGTTIGKYTPCLNVTAIAERYGWTVSTEGEKTVLTNGSDVIKISTDRYNNRYLYSSAVINVNGTDNVGPCYLIGDSYYVVNGSYFDLMTGHDAKIIIDENKGDTPTGDDDKSKDYTATIVAVAIAASVCVIAAFVLIRRFG